MPVNTSSSTKQFAGDGTQTTFPFTFPISGEDDLVVRERVDATGVTTTKTLTTHYTVVKSGANFDNGGNVEMGTAPAAGVTLLVKRLSTQTQSMDLIYADNFDSEAMEDAVDKNTRMIQELQAQLDRCIKIPDTDADTLDMTMPTSVDRASKWQGYDADGQPTAVQTTPASVTVTAFAETVLDDADAAAACVTLNAVNKTEDDLDDISDGTTYKKVADVDANGHPSKVDDAVELQAAVTRYLSISLSAGEHNGGASTNFLGNRLIITDNEDIYLSVNLPHGATVTELYSSADAGAGTASLATHLKRSPLNAVTDETLASCVHTATEGEVTDSSIDDAIIDNNTYTYLTHISHTLHDTDAVVEGIRIKYTITKPLP